MKLYYFVHCNGILGVKTNIRDFKWVYGSVAPMSSFEEFEKCKVKFDVCVKPEKHLSQIDSCDRKFQAFNWSEQNKTLFYRRRLFGFFNIGYNIKIENNVVFAEFGENYYKLIKNRIMNLHSAYYLLSDIANMVLLSNGYITMYASAVHNASINRTVLCFGAPNTGKTYTAVTLVKSKDYKMIGEDVVITDGDNLFSCQWTSSYRNSTLKSDDTAGSIRRRQRPCDINYIDSCKLTDVVVISQGKEETNSNKDVVFLMSSMTNGYLFNYFSSPIIKILGLFDDRFCMPMQEEADKYLKKIVESCNCHMLQFENASRFADEIHKRLTGEIE